jgi:S1-C subfamily serine protease
MLPTFVVLLMLRSLTMNPLELMTRRNVLVETETSQCSGVILSTGVVLTAFHALETDSVIKVNGKEAKIRIVRPDIDLIVLIVETEEVPDITFGMGVGIGTPVVAVGNPVNLTDVVSFGFVVQTKDAHLFTDTLAMHGFSGGGLYSTEGVLLGMMQGIIGNEKNGSWVVVSLGAKEIVEALRTKK